MIAAKKNGRPMGGRGLLRPGKAGFGMSDSGQAFDALRAESLLHEPAVLEDLHLLKVRLKLAPGRLH